MGKFSDTIQNPKRYQWNPNEPPQEPLFFTEPPPSPPKKTKADWLQERERRIWKTKDPFWSKFKLAKPRQSKLSSGKPVPGQWRTANREDGW